MTKAPSGVPLRGRAKVRIVIVDDHEMMCDGLRVLLERFANLDVVGSCGDCSSALRLMAELQPDLMLLDVQLPDGDGIDLTRRIRATAPEIRVLVMTSQVDRRLGRAALAAGAHGFVVKTAAGTVLVSAMRAALTVGNPAGPLPAASFRGETTQAEPPGGGGLDGPPMPVRERQVLQFLLRGHRNKEIAAELGLSIKTVETYRSRLMRRFSCRSTAELVQCVIREGFDRP